MSKRKESPQEQVESSKVEEEDSKVEKPEDSKEPEFEALDDEQAAKAVGDLIEQPVEEEVQEEIQEETQAEETPTEEEAQVEPEIVDDELVEKYPVLRAYHGKPIRDIASGYNSIVTKFMNKSNDFAEMKRKLDNISLQKTDDVPDQQDEPEKFQKWLDDRDKQIRESVQPAEPQVDLIGELTKRLPQGTDVTGIVNKWANKNAQRLFDDTGSLRLEMQSLYLRNPDVLYQEVSEFLQNDEKENENEADVRKAGHKKLQKDFKKARDSKKDMPGAQVQTISKDVKLTREEEMLVEIEELVREG